MRIRGSSIANDFAKNLSATPARMFESFQRQHGGAFAEREAIAMRIKRTALRGRKRLWVASRSPQKISSDQAAHVPCRSEASRRRCRDLRLPAMRACAGPARLPIMQWGRRSKRSARMQLKWLMVRFDSELCFAS